MLITGCGQFQRIFENGKEIKMATNLVLPYKGFIADDCFEVTINEQFNVIIDDQTAMPGEQCMHYVQLASVEECEKLIAELDDKEAELMYKEDSICLKYPELKPLML